MGSFAAHERKALGGGHLPTPMTWIDGGGQLPYSHVVVDVSGSMSAPTFVPNYHAPSESETFSRSDYVMFLLLDMYHKGAIKADTRIYPIGNENKDWGSFISAGFLFGEQWNYFKSSTYSHKNLEDVWPILFGPRAGTTHLRQVTQLPKTKTLLITDVGASELPRALGVSKGSFNHNPPLDVISW